MFLINCTNLKCRKNTEALYNQEDDQVYCADCDEIILNVTSFTKAHLKSSKQIKKAKKDPLAITCATCKHSALPVLNNSNQLTCPKCEKSHSNIPKPFQILIRNRINSTSEE